MTVDVTNGAGVIEVTGDASGSMLLLARCGRCSDGSGSIGMLAALAGANAPSPAEVKSLVDWLSAPDLETLDRSTFAQPPDPSRLRPLLNLLSAGRYRITAQIYHDVAIRPELPFQPRLDDLHRVRSTDVRGPVDEMRWLISDS